MSEGRARLRLPKRVLASNNGASHASVNKLSTSLTIPIPATASLLHGPTLLTASATHGMMPHLSGSLVPAFKTTSDWIGTGCTDPRDLETPSRIKRRTLSVSFDSGVLVTCGTKFVKNQSTTSFWISKFPTYFQRRLELELWYLLTSTRCQVQRRRWCRKQLEVQMDTFHRHTVSTLSQVTSERPFSRLQSWPCCHS